MNTKRGEQPPLRFYLFTHTLIRRTDTCHTRRECPTQVCKVLWNRWTKKTHEPLRSWDVPSGLQTEQNERGDSGKGGCSPTQNKTNAGLTTTPLTLSCPCYETQPPLGNCLWFPVLLCISDVQDVRDWCGFLGLYQEPSKQCKTTKVSCQPRLFLWQRTLVR